MNLCKKRQEQTRIHVNKILKRVNVGAVHKVLSILQLEKGERERLSTNNHQRQGKIISPLQIPLQETFHNRTKNEIDTKIHWKALTT